MLSGVAADPFTASLLSDQPALKSCSTSEFQRLLSAALNDHVIAVLQFDNQLRKLTATVIEPASKLHFVVTHCVLNKRPRLACCNFDRHQSILIILG